MWTFCQISARILLDIVEWQATACWLEDPSVAPVTLQRSGTLRLGVGAGPDEVFQIILNRMRLETEARAVQVSRSSRDDS